MPLGFAEGRSSESSGSFSVSLHHRSQSVTCRHQTQSKRQDRRCSCQALEWTSQTMQDEPQLSPGPESCYHISAVSPAGGLGLMGKKVTLIFGVGSQKCDSKHFHEGK